MVARVYSVDKVDINFTLMREDGAPALAIRAQGMVLSGGWSGPELAPWSYIDPPAGGMLDMDFLADPPDPGTMVTYGFQPIVAVAVLHIPDWVTGVRVHASSNKAEVSAQRAEPPAMRLMGEGLPLPWPFPWYRRLRD